MCSFERPDDTDGTEKLTFVYKPELKILSLEIISADKSFQLLTRKDFDDENSYVLSCESVESVVDAPDTGGGTTSTWQTWDKSTAVSQLAGVTRKATEYCPSQFPFILEQSPTKIKVDCLLRGIGDAIVIYASKDHPEECIAAVNVKNVDSLCGAIADWTSKFVDSAVDIETRNRRRDRERQFVSNPAITEHFLREQLAERRNFFFDSKPTEYWDVSDDENDDW
jgi:hypothetical protein